jgi:outer membrane lipoprotein LolB
MQLVAVLALPGCAVMQPQSQPASDASIHQQHLASLADIRQFNIQGRIGVQTEGRGFSGSTKWQHGAGKDSIALFSPLGSQVANIEGSADGVVLKDGEGKTYRAADAETLTQKTLGWSLPMKGLPDWILGRPTSGQIDESQWDESGRLTRLRQHGWDITYAQYAESQGYQLPGKVSLISPKLNLKLVIESWQLPEAKAGSADAAR